MTTDTDPRALVDEAKERIHAQVNGRLVTYEYFAEYPFDCVDFGVDIVLK